MDTSTWKTPLSNDLFSSEVWRLPPVTAPATPPSGLSTTLTPTKPAAVVVPKALVMTPTDNFAKPAAAAAEPPPTANTPLTLPDGGTAGTKSDKPIKLWSGSFDLGLDGAEGNSEALNFRFAFRTNRKTEQTILTFNVDCLKQTANSVATTDRLFTEGRYEWLFTNSRWSCFIHDTVDYDEFKAYNVCDAADIGWGYRFIKNDDTILIGRIGGGYSHYFGGPDNGKYFPEAVFGASLEQKISKRSKFVGTLEYAPDVDDFERYRCRAQAALDLLLDEENHLGMRIGVLERYTSLQNTTRGNDLDYAVMLSWKF